MKKKESRERFLALLMLSISAAIFCGIWVAFASLIGLIGWAGFAGCTTYFSTGSHGWKGIFRTICTNLLGVACGLAIIALSNWIPALGNWGIWCAVVTFLMCILSYFKLFDFCPGAFMGCFCTFAADDWMILIPSLIAGAFLGFLCDFGGKWLLKFFRKSK